MWSSGSSCVRFALVFAEEKTPSTPSMSLTPPSARQLPTWISLPIRLSWASPALIPASGSIPCVHSRSAGKSHLPSVCRLHPLHIAFRPRGFSPPRRLAPLGGSGMLQPDPDRVRCVSRRLPSARLLRDPKVPLQAVELHPPFLATRLVPFEAFPSSTAVPHHCGLCLPAVVVPHSGCGPAEAVPSGWLVTPTHADDTETVPLASWSRP
jgi:hypothetical protein